MSMNLHAQYGKEKIDLWQTPTQITYTLIGTDKHCEFHGAQARDILKRYCMWVKYSANGVWASGEDANWAREVADMHLKEIFPYVRTSNIRKLQVFAM